MDRKILIVILFLMAVSGLCCAGACVENTNPCTNKKGPKNKLIEKSKVDVILEKLEQQTEALKSYQAIIEYRFSQPLLESETLRKGMLFYKRWGPKRSKLRINFETLKQDDEDEQKYIEQVIFDGVWLIQIDYQIESVRYEQVAEVNEPIDAFDFAGGYLPIVGFADIKDFKKEFEITFIEPNSTDTAGVERLNLKVKPDSVYKNDYTKIDFWVDKKSALPARIVAITVEGDTYDIRLLEPKVNKKLANGVFELETPDNFDENRAKPPKAKQGV